MNHRGYFLTIAAMLVLVTILLLVRDYRPDPLPPAEGVPPNTSASPVVVVVNVPPIPTGIYWLLEDPTVEPTPTHDPFAPTRTPVPTMVPSCPPPRGGECRWPEPTMVPPTPMPTLPVCATPEAGQRCHWPTATPAPTDAERGRR